MKSSHIVSTFIMVSCCLVSCGDDSTTKPPSVDSAMDSSPMDHQVWDQKMAKESLASDLAKVDKLPADSSVSDGIKSCGPEADQLACNFKITDCDAAVTVQLYDYLNHITWRRGVMVIRVPYDDPTFNMVPYVNSLVPTYEPQGIKFIFVLGYDKKTSKIPADAAACNQYKTTLGASLSNLQTLRDSVGAESVHSVFNATTPYCFFTVNHELKNESRLCYAPSFFPPDQFKPDIIKMLDKLVTTQP